MPSAYDTIDRSKLITTIESFLDDNEVRIVRHLLSKTSLEVRIKGTKTKPFDIGSPQGGSISGPLFEIYFENSLKDVRNKIENIKIEIRINNKHISSGRNDIF